MGRMLYFECESGISGDMVVGSLLDLGASSTRLADVIESLGLSGYHIEISNKTLSGVVACDFDVQLEPELENHDHDMAWLYGHEHDHIHGHSHVHDADAGATTLLPNAQAHAHTHSHTHRTPKDVAAIIDRSSLSVRARNWAHRIFDILAEAEAKAHGVSKDEVHFHEVGAIDSIIDVVATAFCLDDLDVSEIIVGALAEGKGQVRTQHGLLPVPVPAVANICAASGLVLKQNEREGEFVTPTGAAIAAAVRTTNKLPEHYRVRAIGIGAGKRAYTPPSMVRAMIIEAIAQAAIPTVETTGEPAPVPTETLSPDLWKLETEVDDCSGEALAFTLELLYSAGAAEAHFLPVFMKKNRPGYQLEVLCTEEHITELEAIIFAHTTSIGVRRTPQWRTALKRTFSQVETPYGPVDVKCVTLPDKSVRTYPEHESLAALSRATGASYQDVLRAALASCS